MLVIQHPGKNLILYSVLLVKGVFLKYFYLYYEFSCTGVTPLYDAASNGHLRIVELLLDRGASAIIKTDEGDTPLNIIKEWYKKKSLSGEDMRLYQSLVSRMTEIMQRAGQKVLAITTKDLSQREPTEITNRRSHEEARRNLQKRSPRRDRSIIVDLDDDDVMSGDFLNFILSW